MRKPESHQEMSVSKVVEEFKGKQRPLSLLFHHVCDKTVTVGDDTVGTKDLQKN